MKNILTVHALFSLGTALVGLFFPFLVMVKYDLSFFEIFLFSSAQWAAFTILLVLFWYVMQPMIRLSYRLIFILGIWANILFYLFLSFGPASYWVLGIQVFLIAIHIALYWPVFHLFAYKSSKVGNRGRFFANFQIVLVAMNLLAPLFSGVLLDLGEDRFVLGGALFFFLLATVFAFSRFPHSFTAEEISLRPDLKLVGRNLRSEPKLVRAIVLGDGVQSSALGFVWAIILKITLVKFLLMGGVLAISALFEIVASRFWGHETDKKSPNEVLKIGVWARFLDISPRAVLVFFPFAPVAVVIGVLAGILGPMFQPAYSSLWYSARARVAPYKIFPYFFWREVWLGLTRAICIFVAGVVFYFWGLIGLGFFYVCFGARVFLLSKVLGVCAGFLSQHCLVSYLV